MNTEYTLTPLKYPLIVAEDSYKTLAELLKQDADSGSSFFILVDENSHQHCLPQLITNVEALTTAEIIEIESGEENKNIETCVQLWEALTDLGADRNSILINLGGGVITDMGGFVASTFKRGIRFYNIPTTLLSQIDASTGSKTGVDLGGLKNQIGLFADPEAVYINLGFLRTLPKEQLQSGFGEIVKHALIADNDYWKLVRREIFTDIKDWGELIRPSLEIKSSVVLKDPNEKGLRKLLNFGHTVGHALETFALENHRPLLHGQAVALGIVAEAWLSTQLSGLKTDELNEIQSVILANFDLFKFEENDFVRILELMKHDKKNVSGEVRLTLLTQIGKGVFNISCNKILLKESLKYLSALYKD
ncbi:MAG: 3-dehydroquinate synthase [Bacteroidota bacterium]|nr:3-dehydroquinate synthase [Bacteroidota bacterium]